MRLITGFFMSDNLNLGISFSRRLNNEYLKNGFDSYEEKLYRGD